MVDLRSARRGVAIVFFVYGAVLATWVSRIPLIKQELGLDTAQLSLALLGSPVGLILAMQAVAVLVDRWTSAVVTRVALLGACVAVVLPGVAWSLGSLAAALLLLGFSLGSLDIAMNTQGVAVERGYARPVMSGIHAMYSVGVLAGAGVGALAASADVDPLAHFAVAAAVLAGIGMVGARTLLGAAADQPAEVEDADRPPLRLAQHPALIALGFVAFCCLFAEGAVDDWSGVYLREEQGASLGVAALGAAAAGAGMAIGRFGGDAVIARFGRPGDAVVVVARRRRGDDARRARPGAGRRDRRLLRARARGGDDRADRVHARRHAERRAAGVGDLARHHARLRRPVREPADDRPRGPSDEPHRRARHPGRPAPARRAAQPLSGPMSRSRSPRGRPRSGGSSSTTSRSGATKGTSRSCAIRSPGAASKRASPRLTSTTRISPR